MKNKIQNRFMAICLLSALIFQVQIISAQINENQQMLWQIGKPDKLNSEFALAPNHGGEIKAYANIEGPMAFYMGGDTPATVYEISFIRKTWSDKVKLLELSPVFYSEVMWDIDQLINAV